MIGMLATFRVHPHVVNDDGVRIRKGLSVDITIPWTAIDSVSGGIIPKAARRTTYVEDSVLHVGVLSQSNVEIALREPTTVPVPQVGHATVTEVRIYVDDPGAFTKWTREKLTATEARPIHGRE